MAYIDRDLLLKDISESVVFSVRSFDSPELRGAKKVIDRIRNAPAVDVVEVKHSQWHMYSYDEAMCLNCGYVRRTPFESTNEARANWHTLPNHCEECGAKMDGRGEV